MNGWIVVALVAAVTLAGCTDDPGANGDPGSGVDGIRADTTSTDPEVLEAILETSHLEGEAPLEVTFTVEVKTTLEDLHWDLQMRQNGTGAVFRMGEGGVDDLPKTRNITLEEGEYTTTFTATGDDESSQARVFVTVLAAPVENECLRAEGYNTVVVEGQGVHFKGDGETWRETNGMEGLQTPESCPGGPHDERID